MTEYRIETSLEGTGPSRATVHIVDKTPLDVAPPPKFGGPEGVWTPEDLLVSSVETCLMMTFSNLAERRGLPIESYSSRAVGILTKDSTGMRFTRFEIHPCVRVAGGPERVEQATTLLDLAHEKCMVARSLSAAVEVRPSVQAVEAPVSAS